MPFISIIILVVSLLVSPITAAATQYRVAIISDGPRQQRVFIEDIVEEELFALTEGEFEVSFKRFEADWSVAGIEREFEKAYADPGVDMLLAVGIAANQIGVTRESYPKPTFLPAVFDIELLGAPTAGTVSGKHNLNYIANNVAFKQRLINFLRIAPLKKVALLGDELVIQSLPVVSEHASRVAERVGVELVFVGDKSSTPEILDALPDDVDGVIVSIFPRMSDADYLAMIEEINRRKLPSFSPLGSHRVAQGVLFSDVPETDWQRLARSNALNMQAVMLGENAADQPILFESKVELTINMDTARQLDISPSFELRSEAVLLSPLPEDRGPVYTLADVARLAVERNLQLTAEALGVDAGRYDINSARANLLPQLSLDSSYARRKQSAAVQAGRLVEKSGDGSATLSQLLYSDSAWANLKIQGQLQNNREAAFDQSRLDTIQSATIAYLNVLRAQTQLRVQRDNLDLTKTNLELARDRVRVGFSSAADVYRWESRIASDRSSLLEAIATLNQARENLNRILHRPITEVFQTAAVSKGDPFAMPPEEFDELIDSPRQYSYYTDFILEIAYGKSPELAQLEAQMAAQRREITNRSRSFWLPDFSLSSRYSENLNQSGLGAGFGEGESDWTVSLNATLPLFDGGARRAELSQARLELKQLQALHDATRQQIEQQTRSNIHASTASYISIELSAEAALAGNKNLELVTDAYAKGVVSIIDLLDAQNASLQADEAAANAVYDFLIDIMNMQRSVGLFEFTLPETDQEMLAEQLRQYIQRRSPGEQ